MVIGGLEKSVKWNKGHFSTTSLGVPIVNHILTMTCDVSTFLEDFCLSSLPESTSIFVCVVVIILCFYGLSIVCDEFLVPALEVICDKFLIAEDVAGVTFMAFGSAAPEIVINCVSTLRASLKGESAEGHRDRDLGVGAIMGSGIIAFSIIPGICALVSPEGRMVLKRRPLMRDVLTYTLCLGWLIYLVDNVEGVTCTKALLFLVIYALFVLVVVVAPKLKRRLDGTGEKRKSFVMERKETLQMAKQLSKVAIDYGAIEGDVEGHCCREEERTLLDKAWNGVCDDSDDDEFFDGTDSNVPNPLLQTIFSISQSISFLLRFPTLIIIPHATIKNKNPNYFATFLLSFVFVSMYSYVLSTSIMHLTTISPMSPTFYGTVLVSIGAEIPDMVQCAAVAKRGYGAMAVSNALGSQVLNIAIGLGLPWAISTSSGNGFSFVHANKEVGDHLDLNAASRILFLCVCMFGVLTIGKSVVVGQKPSVGVAAGRLLTSCYFVAMGSFVAWYFFIKPPTVN